MGKQFGIINVRGKVGDMSYVKTEDGYFIRRSTSVDKKRIATDDAFKNTRLVNKEFGTAGKTSKMLRDAVLIQLKTSGDSRLASRMVKIMMQVLKQDTTSRRGDRAPWNGDLSLFDGFEFNKKNELVSTFLVPFAPSIDRPSGKLSVDVPGFDPGDVLMIPDGATYFNFVSGGCEIDFENNTNTLAKSESDYFPVDSATVNAFTLLNQLPANSTLPLFIVLGIRFYTKVNDVYYQLRGNDFNALRIVGVDQP